MSQEMSAVERVESVRAYFRRRNEARGYSVSYKRVAMAYGVEFVVMIASLYGAWLFAKQYGHGDETMMHIVRLAYAGMNRPYLIAYDRHSRDFSVIDLATQERVAGGDSWLTPEQAATAHYAPTPPTPAAPAKPKTKARKTRQEPLPVITITSLQNEVRDSLGIRSVTFLSHSEE